MVLVPCVPRCAGTAPPSSEDVVQIPNVEPQLDTEAGGNETDDSTKDVADLPDGAYGWVCTVCMLLITANTWGINGAFGTYLSHYLSANTYPGTSRITYAFIGGLSISQITFIAPLVTYCTKRFGTHRTLCIGLVLETAALVAASFATKVWHVLLTQGVLFGWGCSFLSTGAGGIVPQWFTKRRFLANSIAAAGSGLGGLAWSLGTQAMISSMSLAWSFRITAIVSFVMNAICTVLIRDRNKQILPDQKAFDVSLLRRRPFLYIMGWAYTCNLGYTLILFSLPDNAVAMGFSARTGSLAGALANLGMAVGRPIVGYLSDKYGRINIVTGATALCAVWCLCLWTTAKTAAALLAFSFLGGTVCGTCYAMIGPLFTEIFGLKLLPSCLSVYWALVAILVVFAEPIGLALNSIGSGRYLPVQLFTGAAFLAATVFMVLLRAWTLKNMPLLHGDTGKLLDGAVTEKEGNSGSVTPL